MSREVVELTLTREPGTNQSWGLRLVGGLDVGTVLKVEKVLGLTTPAYKGGVMEGDVLVSVEDTLVTLMKHGQVVDLIKRVSGPSLRITVERGELVVPNMADCFPVTGDRDLEAMTEEERRLYWKHAMDQGLGSRLIPKHFTTVGKMKVKTPKYNCPQGLYSDTTMDEMISGSSSVDPSKLDPEGPAYAKMMKSKKFDPRKSQVLEVMADQERGNFAVDTAAVRQEREEGAHEGGRRI